MHSALKIVAFSHHTPIEGARALLETALAALDSEGLRIAAIHVDLALNALSDEPQLTDEYLIQHGLLMKRDWMN